MAKPLGRFMIKGWRKGAGGKHEYVCRIILAKSLSHASQKAHKSKLLAVNSASTLGPHSRPGDYGIGTKSWTPC